MVAKLAAAAVRVADGASEALQLIGKLPQDIDAFLALGIVERTAARALLKAVEQQQDILARSFRTYLIAEAVDVIPMTARDIANMMEKLGGLDDAYLWSDLVKLRNRLATNTRSARRHSSTVSSRPSKPFPYSAASSIVSSPSFRTRAICHDRLPHA